MTGTRLDRLPAPLTPLVRTGLRLVTLAYRVRYPRRLRCGRDVVILGGLRIRQGTRVELGDRVRVRRGVLVNGGGTLVVGPDTLLNGCWVGASTRVEIGAGCLVSDCSITDNDFHNLEPGRRHEPADARTRSPVRLGDNVWVGAQAWVLKGTRIGDDSVVGAVAVVRGEVPPGVLVSGNPAQVVRRLPGTSTHPLHGAGAGQPVATDQAASAG